MKNVLFSSKNPKIFKKRALGEYMHPYGTLKVLLCRFSGENRQNFGFWLVALECACRVQILPQALFKHFSGGLTI